uniref:Uncharacterized protein n=1 Tax=Strongyloides papillosus TaxID=174720 RepID=A0A0N5CFS7_STREA
MMSLQVYFIAAVLALVQLLIYSKGQHNNNLFPNIIEDFYERKYYDSLKINSRSDIIAVKCPYVGYLHNSDNEKFISNMSANTLYEPKSYA